MSGASTIGERIKAVRLRTGLGQDAFAKALGYSKRALVSWELGGAEPPVALMAKLRRDYDVDPEWVILGEDTVPRSYYGPVDSGPARPPASRRGRRLQGRRAEAA